MASIDEPCVVPINGRRRAFWSTQPAACGTRISCGETCGVAGLSLIADHKNCSTCGTCCNGPQTSNIGGVIPGDVFENNACTVDPCTLPRTISTANWIQGLVLNMLLTDGRHEDKECGWRPGGMNGHWSESFIEGGSKIGTSLRYMPTGTSINEAVRTVKAYIQDTLQKLVLYKVATGVEVEVVYLGGGNVSATATIKGSSGTLAKVGLTGSRLANSWAWNS